MPTKPLRLRAPTGVSTLQVDFDGTVQDLQIAIRDASGILPSQQELKAGYPPRALTLIPELPLASLGLQPGDQLILSTKPGSAPPAAAPASAPAPAGSTTRSATAPGRAPATPATSAGPDHVQTEGGYLIHRIVPDDNSCLFSSIALIFKQDISHAQAIRKLVVDTISANPDTYTPAILGQPVSAYLAAIARPSAWGGAIELSALARAFNTEIASVDVETGRVDAFAPPEDAPAPSAGRCVVVYSGIHYDAATLAPTPDAPGEWHQTVFPVTGPVDSDPIIRAAKELATKLRAKRAYTNTATFDLKCEICKQGLKGEKEARAHAAQTGHTSFGEY